MKRSNTELRPYPPSRGEKAAARIRAKANTLGDERRSELMTLGATILLTSDGHILDIDRDQLHLALQSFDVDPPIRVAPWQVAKLFRR
jgi:hypothetical protein